MMTNKWFLAIRKGDVQFLTDAIHQSDVINETNNRGDSALLLAVKTNQLHIVELLLENGADVNAANQYQDTPLSVAVANRKVEMIRMLIEAGADVNFVDPTSKQNLVEWCIETNYLDVIEVFLEYMKSFTEENQALLKKVRLQTLFV